MKGEVVALQRQAAVQRSRPKRPVIFRTTSAAVPTKTPTYSTAPASVAPTTARNSA
jgi:hypothetical protein